MAIKYTRQRPTPATPRRGRTPFLRLETPPKRIAFLRYFGLFFAIVVVIAGTRFQQRTLYSDRPLEIADGVVIRVEPQRFGGIALELALVDHQGATLVATTTVTGAAWKTIQPGAPIRATFYRTSDGQHFHIETCIPK